MIPLMACLTLTIMGSADPSADEILARLANTSAIRHQAVYSGLRQYSIHNLRFGKSASVQVRTTADPVTGKQFTILSRSASAKLIEVVESLLLSESNSSRPHNARGHQIGPANYNAILNGSETIADRDCWVLSLKPKQQSKYLLDGRAWVDKSTYAVVRLEGTTAARVSMWVGSPHIVEEFAPVDGIWFPVRTP
jgi:hypothetical protein